MINLNLFRIPISQKWVIFSLSVGYFTILIAALILTFGTNFPVPWVDESYFLQQAIAYAHNNSFLTPSLIPDRPLMWMPPGYVILMGHVFKLIDFSLQAARMVSFAFYCVSLLLLPFALRVQNRSLVLFFTAAIFLTPSSLAAANVARMDSIVLALALGVLLALVTNRWILALALAIIACLVHPNGAYLFVPIVLSGLLALRLGLTLRFMDYLKNNLFDFVLLVLALLLMFFYIAHIHENFIFFQTDMEFQFNRKLSRIPFYRDLRAIVILGLALILVMWFLYRDKHIKAVISTMATIFILIFANGQEMWYQVFRNVGIGMLMIVVLDEVSNIRWRRSLTVLLICSYFTMAGLNFAGMRPSLSREDYLGQNFKIRLQEYLVEAQQSKKEKLSIAFNSTGADILVYERLTALGIDIVRRMPVEITSPRSVDICIYIARMEDPAWLRVNPFEDLPEPALCRSGMLLSESRDDFRVLDATEYAVMWQRN